MRSERGIDLVHLFAKDRHLPGFFQIQVVRDDSGQRDVGVDGRKGCESYREGGEPEGKLHFRDHMQAAPVKQSKICELR